MPISFTCTTCAKRLKAPDALAGKRLPCPNCKEKLMVPRPEEDAAAYLLASESPPEPAEPYTSQEGRRPVPVRTDTPRDEPPVKPRPKAAVPLAPLTATEVPLWQRHLHWLLVLALLPLAVSLLDKNDAKQDLNQRLLEALLDASPEVQGRLERVLEKLEKGEGSIEDLFAALPGNKLRGAFLARRSLLHWLYAAVAAALFLGFCLLLSGERSARRPHLLAGGLFTATAGILFLVLVQYIAEWSQGVWMTGANVVTLLFYFVKLIGFSYRAAMDPENGFFLSFLGYTLGVGFCEEVCKALPLLWHYRHPTDQTWRGAFLWGMASGAGFGIAEGIMYSGNYYNGISGPGIYVVRFISCVALHALWTGSVGITLNQKQELLRQAGSWYDWIAPLLLIVGVPMVLHGLYDTLLKKEMNALALGVAVASFIYLAHQTSRLHGADDETATEEMLAEYQRRRKGLT